MYLLRKAGPDDPEVPSNFYSLIPIAHRLCRGCMRPVCGMPAEDWLLFLFFYLAQRPGKKDVTKRQVADQVKQRHLTPLLLLMFPGRKLSPKQGVTMKPRCYFNSPMKYFDRYMRFKWHLGLTQHRGNAASYRLKPLLDVSLHGLKALLSKMKTCIWQNSTIKQYTMAHP